MRKGSARSERVFAREEEEARMRNTLMTLVAIAVLTMPPLRAQDAARPTAQAPSTTPASAAPSPKGAKPATPALPDAKTLVRDVGIAHGMLRGLQFNDATTTAQYQATGTQYIVGQSFQPGGS